MLHTIEEKHNQGGNVESICCHVIYSYEGAAHSGGEGDFHFMSTISRPTLSTRKLGNINFSRDTERSDASTARAKCNSNNFRYESIRQPSNYDWDDRRGRSRPLIINKNDNCQLTLPRRRTVFFIYVHYICFFSNLTGLRGRSVHCRSLT